MLNDIFKWRFLIEYEPEVIEAGAVTVLKDFGPWKKGDYMDLLQVCLETGHIKQLSNAKEVVKECHVHLQPL